MLQAAGAVACMGLGYTGGLFRIAGSEVPPFSQLPPWVGTARCDGGDPVIAECDRVGFGGTSACGATMALFCSSDAASAPPPRPQPALPLLECTCMPPRVCSVLTHRTSVICGRACAGARDGELRLVGG